MPLTVVRLVFEHDARCDGEREAAGPYLARLSYISARTLDVAQETLFHKITATAASWHRLKALAERLEAAPAQARLVRELRLAQVSQPVASPDRPQGRPKPGPAPPGPVVDPERPWLRPLGPSSGRLMAMRSILGCTLALTRLELALGGDVDDAQEHHIIDKLLTSLGPDQDRSRTVTLRIEIAADFSIGVIMHVCFEHIARLGYIAALELSPNVSLLGRSRFRPSPGFEHLVIEDYEALANARGGPSVGLERLDIRYRDIEIDGLRSFVVRCPQLRWLAAPLGEAALDELSDDLLGSLRHLTQRGDMSGQALTLRSFDRLTSLTVLTLGEGALMDVKDCWALPATLVDLDVGASATSGQARDSIIALLADQTWLPKLARITTGDVWAVDGRGELFAELCAKRGVEAIMTRS